ncbi:type II toxin-antitoxin system HicA family toxin [Paenibacillus larvae]|nr:type II toxin-antitoxin system HicA family toxin [Paenibacillus larvae]MDT2243112.1 type II toxin-antitoxin system HicA family toxin [Paenibacillus larvae]
MGKQVTVREALQKLKAGFIKSPSHTGKSSHQRYIHKDDPERFADISFHKSCGAVIPKGTLKNIERTSGVKF